ncbi:MAG: LPS assembly lipoprotein LptE [Pseudomonadota bacterium]
MSSFSRRAFLLTLPAALAACGFQPAFAPGGPASRLRSTVKVDDPVGRPGYLFTRHVEERLGRPSQERYGLSYSISLAEQAIAISEDNVTTRFNLLGSVTYALRDLDSKAVLVSGTADSFTSYSAAGTTVATQAAERAAEERLITILADQIITRLTAEAASLPA